MGRTRIKKSQAMGRQNRNCRAKVKELVGEMGAMLDYPYKYFPILLYGPHNTLYWENRDRIHELQGDDLPEVKEFERKLLRKALSFGIVIYAPEKDREGKPYSH
jgi:hypothetical protein